MSSRENERAQNWIIAFFMVFVVLAFSLIVALVVGK